MTTPNLKQPGRINRRSRQEARAERGRLQKADINPQIQALYAQIAALRDVIGAVSQSAADAAGGASPTFWMNNGSGGALSAGDVVVVDSVTARSVTTTTDSADPRPAGVVLTLGPTAAGEDVELRFIGQADANVDADYAAVEFGDPLTLHTTAKYLRRAEPLDSNVVAVAGEALASGQAQIAVFMVPSFRQALNALMAAVGARVRKELHYDAGDRLASAHWYWSASAAAVMRHYYFGYSGDYLLTLRYSQYGTDGGFAHSVTKAFDYVGGMLDTIVAEVVE